jgi:hypothetical protein
MKKLTPARLKRLSDKKDRESTNPNGRPPNNLCFTVKFREELTKEKKFRRPDGTIFESTELDLIVAKVVKELRQGNGIDSKLLSLILDRVEGKPKESLELEGKLEVGHGIDARSLILQRLGQKPVSGEGEESDSQPE